MNTRGDQQALEKEDAKSGSELALSLAIADYDRTLPIINGQVRPEGITLDVTTSFDIGDFCHRPIYEQFDCAEMSLSWYVAARCRNEPVIAIPVFPLRMPVLGYLFCRADAPYINPRGLLGKRIAVRQYRLTVNLWMRGIFKELYGLAPDQVQWVTREREGAAFVVPQGVKVDVLEGRSAEELLLNGEVDAILGATVPQSFLRGDPRIRRLFPDAREEMRKYVARTGFIPVTHVVVMKDSLAKEQPWVAQNMVEAFREAQRICDELNLEPKRHSHPESVFILEEQRKAYGESVWTHGLEPNRPVIETFIRYAYEQGYIPRLPEVKAFFVPSTLST